MNAESDHWLYFAREDLRVDRDLFTPRGSGRMRVARTTQTYQVPGTAALLTKVPGTSKRSKR